MTTRTMLDEPALFKPDSLRRIDRVIDYFGGVTRCENPPEDGGDKSGASGDPEAPWPS